MKLWEITSVPGPETFFGLEPGDNLSLFYRSGQNTEVLLDPNTSRLVLRTTAIASGAGAVTLSGIVVKPPELQNKMLLADIVWDESGYSGTVAISEYGI